MKPQLSVKHLLQACGLHDPSLPVAVNLGGHLLAVVECRKVVGPALVHLVLEIDGKQSCPLPAESDAPAESAAVAAAEAPVAAEPPTTPPPPEAGPVIAPTPREVLRVLEQHKGNGLNEALKVVVYDGPGAGGMSHEYGIVVPHNEPGVPFWNETVYLHFQKGPIKEAGVNGISVESLLAICIDRLQGAQDGPFACQDNEDALDHLIGALDSLKKRTLTRTKQGVEGTNVQHVEESPAPTGKLKKEGRPFPVPDYTTEPGYSRLHADTVVAMQADAKAGNTFPIDTRWEWFDSDNGQWWKASETLIDWDTIGAIRMKFEPQAEPTTPAPEVAPAPAEVAKESAPVEEKPADTPAPTAETPAPTEAPPAATSEAPAAPAEDPKP